MKNKLAVIIVALCVISVLFLGDILFGCYVAVTDYFSGDPAVPQNNEIVLTPNTWIEATTKIGTIKVKADNGLRRHYSWDGITRSVVMSPRKRRWYGSYGIYFSGPGFHWIPYHNGIARGVLEEGQQNFKSTEDVIKWIEEHQPLIYRDDGLAVRFMKIPSRQEINVDVWQMLINGNKPRTLPNSNNKAIKASWDLTSTN